VDRVLVKSVLCQLLDVVDPAYGDNRIGTQVCADDQGLVLEVADAADTDMAIHLAQVIVELRPELGVFDVFDEARKSLAVLHSHAPAPRAQVGMVIRAVEQVLYAIIFCRYAKYTTHRNFLSFT